MKDHMARLREEALAKERERKSHKSRHDAHSADEEITAPQAARFLGAATEVVAACCGSICANCDVFLDKAIALTELGYPHHLFMNSSQEEKFLDALEIFRRDRAEYRARRQELMDRMRR